MAKLILEKSVDFDKVFNKYGGPIKDKLKEIFRMEFATVGEFKKELYENRELPLSINLPKECSIKFSGLPITIKEWPLYYETEPGYFGTYEIARLKVVG